MEVKKKTLVKPVLNASEVKLLNDVATLFDTIIEGNACTDVIVGEEDEICTILDLTNLRTNLGTLAQDLTREEEPA